MIKQQLLRIITKKFGSSSVESSGLRSSFVHLYYHCKLHTQYTARLGCLCCNLLRNYDPDSHPDRMSLITISSLNYSVGLGFKTLN